MRLLLFVFCLSVVLFVNLACDTFAPAAAPTPPSLTVTAPKVPTLTPNPTTTPVPTQTPEPTATPVPSSSEDACTESYADTYGNASLYAWNVDAAAPTIGADTAPYAYVSTHTYSCPCQRASGGRFCSCWRRRGLIYLHPNL